MYIDRQYAVKSKVTVVNGSSSSEQVETRRLVHIKPDDPNRVLPDSDGFRKPAPWTMTWLDGDMYCVGSVEYAAYGNSVKKLGPYDGFAVPSSHAPPVPSWLSSQCEMACLAKLKSPVMNLPVTIGERKQTANLIYDSCKRIGEAYKLFRRKQYKEAASVLGISVPGARDHWLAYRYGWIPLISDVYALTGAILADDKANAKRLRTKVSAERLHDVTTKTFSAYPPVRGQVTTLTWYRSFVRFDFGPPEGYVASLGTLDDWGILNPALVAWELVPFSFVADWFLPVGDYLSSLGLVPYTMRGGSRTEFTTRSTIVQLTGLSSGAIVAGNVNAISRAQGKHMKRIVYTSFPYPSPSGALHMSTIAAASATIAKRVVDAVALLSGTKVLR